MIDKDIYYVSTTTASYTPKDQTNLEKAVREAVEISQIEKKPVELHFGKDMFLIDAGLYTDKLVKEYLNAINYRLSLSQYVAKMKGGHQ